MRCDEIQEHLIELLYDEPDTSSVKPEVEAHISSCPECRRELAELRNAVTPFPARKFGAARLVRYAAVAAMVLLAFLALANAELTWNSEEFSFKTHWAARGSAGSEYYTKEEMLSILKSVLDDYEGRMMEGNLLMLKKMLDTVEAERYFDLQKMAFLNRNRNDD